MSLSASIVIPAYNSARYLAAALDSVRAQTRNDCEIVVVDDGSTDGTPEIARGYGVRLFEQSHGGASAARNRAIREASAPVIAFLDSDDLWHADHLATMLELLERDEGAIGATSGVELLTSEGRPTGQVWIFGRPGADLLRISRKGCPFLTSATVVRRDALLAEPFDETLTTANDWDLWLRLLLRGRFALAGRVTAGYRRHGAALSTNVEARARNRQRIVAKHAAEPWVDTFAAYVELHDARNALAAGRRIDADAHLARAGQRYPAITEDLQWWPFFESFRPHASPDVSSRPAFWRAVRGFLHVCASRALPFARGQRRRAVAEGFDTAASFAHLARLRPESLLFRALNRIARVGLAATPPPAPPSGSGTGPSAR